MASLIEHKDASGKLTGYRTIQFTDGDRQRKTIRLGKMSQKIAKETKAKVEALLERKLAQISWEPELAAWVGKLPEVNGTLYDKLAAVDLLPPRGPREKPTPVVTLGSFLDDAIRDRKATVSRSTLQLSSQVKAYLIEKFGREKLLADFSEGDGDKWRIWLGTSKGDGGKGLAPNTVRKRCAIARLLFKSAVRQRLIPANPFAEIEGGVTVRANKAREYFVTREQTQKLLDNASNEEFQLIIALCRYGALRCPSEIVGLTWADFNWGLERLTVRSPKTAHHEGHELRVIPIFPELRKYVDAVYFDPASDETYVLRQYRKPGVNLRSALLRVIDRAGLTPWPKLFQNLRASRATELAHEHPEHVVTAWCGHSKKVAMEHYRMVTDVDYKKALHKALHNPDAANGNEGNSSDDEMTETPENAVFSGEVYERSVVREGLEPPTKGL